MGVSSSTVEQPTEIATILDRLQRECSLTVVTFGNGHAIVSSILEVRHEPGTFVFDIAGDAHVNDRLFDATAVRFESEIDHVQIVFEATAPARMSFTDGPAAMVGLPSSVTRLHRRRSPRAALPVHLPVHCTVVGPGGRASPAHAIDLSCDGAAVVVDAAAMDDIAVEGDHELILSLPNIGRLGIVANLRTVLPADGETESRVRLGFRFDEVPPETAARIRRYVQQIQRRQQRRPKPD